MKRSYDHLLKPGERLDLSDYPWTFHQGQLVRARCSWDLDPQEKGNFYSLVFTVCDCRIRKKEPASTGNGNFHYYAPLVQPPRPSGIISEYEFEVCRQWGGVEYIPWGGSTQDMIPLSAIKRSLLDGYARRLAQRSADIERGIFS